QCLGAGVVRFELFEFAQYRFARQRQLLVFLRRERGRHEKRSETSAGIFRVACVACRGRDQCLNQLAGTYDPVARNAAVARAAEQKAAMRGEAYGVAWPASGRGHRRGGDEEYGQGGSSKRRHGGGSDVVQPVNDARARFVAWDLARASGSRSA